ncbi:4-hydroxy-tetrahydrodipicolinate reductase [bacterium]|nr:4-hydroxy-tetrahydrodipicolinate reductase [bacterium]
MNVFVIGAQGRMGKEIQKVLKKTRGLSFVGGLARETKGKMVHDFSLVAQQPDLVIDFSSPESFLEGLQWSAKNKIPFLSGTTGLKNGHFSTLQNASQKIPVLWTANTSIGIQMVKDILRATPLPKSFDVRMTEWHHIHKKDKPSGTALVLQKILEEKRKNLRKPKSVREGEIVGTHRIEIISKEEIITIEHKALRRAVFAKGAVEVGVWLAKQKPGLYTMEDYLQSI